ncbi:maleylpyruvate isomerase family mycothiol-dependent enzyme [Sphaerisporangium sp. NPDC088356]|uniref:maleylpyruvate isomerase family mycothiol-dependent enzyme n=1 Tax=Sphaerisporangium sp. NPDC088356 TaxID=3154871 RepID=UPI00343E3476
MEIEGRWTHDDYCSALEAELGRFAEIVENADPAAKVPTCPGWTIAKLLKHVGITQRWAEYLVRHRVAERMSSREVPVTLPDDDTGYPAWLAAGGASLVATLREADPGTPMWSWGIDQHASFWSRRMLHEGTVHRTDTEIALGREPRIDSRVATDGVDEFLDNLAVATWVADSLKELPGDGEVLHFHATDVDAGGEWTVTLGPDGFSWRHGHGKGDVAVRGAVSDLLLLLYGRLKPADGRFEVFGDRELLARWLEKTAI